MHGSASPFVVLLVYLAGAVAVPFLAASLRLPGAVLLIAYGVALGPHALALTRTPVVMEFLYTLGFVVLMFLAGMEIDFNAIRRRGRRALGAVVLICVAITGLAVSGAALAGLHPIYGLALGAMSVGLPLAVLRETGQLRSPLGQQILLIGSVGEFITVLGMTLFYFVTRYGLSVQLLLGLARLVALLAVAGLTLRIFMAVAWWRPERFSRLVDAREHSELGVRASLLLMVAFSLLCVAAGLEAIVGAFVAGALISFVLRGKEVLEEKLSVVGHGLFVPLFFIEVGTRFDLGAVTRPSLTLAAGLLAATFVVRLLPCLWLLRLGVSLRETLGTASLLSSPLTLVVAIAGLGLQVGVLRADGVSTLVVLAVASGVVFPVLFRSLVRAA